jgi:hypothetical protein
MDRLEAYIAMRHEIEVDYEREVKAVLDLLGGIKRIEGREHWILLGASDGYAANGQARAMFVRDLQMALRDTMLNYMRNLCLEGVQLGVSSALLEGALKAQTPEEPARSYGPISDATSAIIRQFPYMAALDQPMQQRMPEGQARHIQESLAAALAAA